AACVVDVCDVCRRYFFFFQAEDGIRDRNVTGVQTCALPIWELADGAWTLHEGSLDLVVGLRQLAAGAVELRDGTVTLSEGADEQIGRASCRERVTAAGAGGG